MHAAFNTDENYDAVVQSATAEFEALFQARADAGLPEVTMPKEFPLGFVIGCVNIVDCFDRDSLETQHTDLLVGQPLPEKREIGTSFGFVCTNPIVLKRPIKCRGGKDVFKLPPDVQRMCHVQLPKH